MRRQSENLILVAICITMIVPIVFIIFGATHESGWMFSIPFDYSLGSYFFK